jgi:SSS family solute:Na+ symporter
MTVRFGQIFVVVMVLVAMFLANMTYDKNSSDNFFLTLANQTSYIKPGLVVAFFWGVFWKKTNPMAAVITLVASPFIGLACDWIYAEVLVNSAWVVAIFGQKLNFLYRVFCIFVLGSLLLYVLSLVLNRRGGRPSTASAELTVEVEGMGQVVWPFLAVHAPLITLAWGGWLSPQVAAWPAALLTLGIFLYFFKKSDTPDKLWHADLFYAGLLSGAATWIMYYFA